MTGQRGDDHEGGDSHQAADDKVHMAFYDYEHNVSFVWNGSRGDEVDVCFGGYGEPVGDRFCLTPPAIHTYVLETAFEGFKQQCLEYIEFNHLDAVQRRFSYGGGKTLP